MRYLFTFILLLAHEMLHAQITIPYSSASVVIEGIMTGSEWASAATTDIDVNGTDKVKVFYQHDFNAMYFAFTGKLESGGSLFPEILIDAKRKKGNSWTNEQFWFHVSASLCDVEGAYGIYTNCAAVQSSWSGAPVFTPGPPNTDTVEIKIPFAKIGVNPYTTDAIDIVFQVTNTATIWKAWPASADRNVPDTWGEAFIGKWPSAITQNNLNKNVRIYPNPAKEQFTIEAPKGSTASLTNLLGQIVFQKQMDSDAEQISTRNLNKGVYIVSVKKEELVTFQKLVIE